MKEKKCVSFGLGASPQVKVHIGDALTLSSHNSNVIQVNPILFET